MSVFRDADDLREELLAFLRRFLSSPDGAAVAAQAAALEAPAVLELRVSDPDVTVHVDLAARVVVDGPAPAPGAVAAFVADDLHQVLLDQLGPIELSRLAEEDRLALVGPPPALAAVFMVAGRIQPHYAASLRERGRDDLLATPPPVTAEIWRSAVPPAPVFGVRRPWQRPKGTAAASA